jgi:hypothetical protein
MEAYVRTLNVPAQVSLVPSAGEWYRPDTVHAALLPHEIVQAIPALF